MSLVAISKGDGKGRDGKVRIRGFLGFQIMMYNCLKGTFGFEIRLLLKVVANDIDDSLTPHSVLSESFS